MAALQLACPSCKTVLKVGEENRGKAVRCPKCQTVLKIPAAAPAQPAAPFSPAKPPTAPPPPARPPAGALLPAVPPRPAAPNAAIAPKPVSPPAPPIPLAGVRPTPAPKGKGLPLLPVLALGALLLFFAGCGTVTGLFLFARMMGSARPTPVADADMPPPGQPGDPGRNLPPNSNSGKPDGNTLPPLTEDQKFAAAFLGDGCTGVVLTHPKRLLASDYLAALPQEKLFESVAALNLDPREADVAVAVVDPTPLGNMPVSVGGAVRFAEKLNARLLKLGFQAKEATFEGKTYYVSEKPGEGPSPAYYLADDHTIAAGPEPILKKMLSAKGEKQPLLDRLRAADRDSDVVAAVVVEPMRQTVSAGLKQFFMGAPPGLAEAAGLGDQVNAVALTANITKEPLLAVDVEAKDEKTAGDVLKFVTNFRAQAEQHYDEMRAGLLSGLPPDAPPNAKDLIDRFSGDLKKNFTAKAEGPHVRISVDRPAAMKDLIAKLGPIAPELFAPRPVVEPPPPPIAKDVRELGVDWVRANNALGPTHKIVEDAQKRLNDQVGFDQGFVATLGAKLVKSQKPTMLVGWNSDVFPLELTPEQGKQADIADAVLGVTAVPAGDDVGPGQPIAKLSGLTFDHADALDGAARMTGAVSFHRLRPDAADEYHTIRLMILAPRTRVTVYQHLDRVPLPKGDGPIALDFAPLNDRMLGLNGPVPVVVEVVAYLDLERQGKPFVVSNAAATLIVPSGK